MWCINMTPMDLVKWCEANGLDPNETDMCCQPDARSIARLIEPDCLEIDADGDVVFQL